MVADLRMASPAAVELVNPKHRNERKTHMALITSYHVPGLYVEDHSIDVPLDWRGLEPMLLAVGSTMRRGAMPAPIAGAPESIKLFYRVVCAPGRINDDLPLLLFLQGGPGGESSRPLSPTSDGWIEEAVKHFRVVLPDQRGTGRSSCVDGARLPHWASARRRPTPMPHARRLTSSSATLPAPSCAILSTCVWWALAASPGSRSARATAAF